MIEVRNAQKRYGRHTAVKDISFSVGKGEVVGFLGPNGAGKTTTLRMLTGYLPPSSGTISIAGYDIFSQSVDARKHIGYMPENVPLYDDMRVREYLRYRAALKGLKGSMLRTYVNEAMDLCALQHVRRKMIKTLSKGYRQRVGLADALVAKPDLLILDEPTNGLDPNQIRQIRSLIKRLGEKHTILISTHILSEVEMICDHVIIVDEGIVKASGKPDELVATMRAAGKVTVELKAEVDEVKEAIEGLDKVKKVIVEEPDCDWNKFSVLVESGTDARSRIAKLTMAKGWPMRTLYRHQATLEDIFVEMTRKD
ncbi:ABC transporter ATP-binding protein [Persicirhabdus sediminis]|uniref:ABC transporter ATP-binding protein n=1 Tax=Persicirhabdus sediminis TaxID=454144 RepID=A0A8J7MDC0_9BACT|nr:ABC transporter ATP-binding protein [Persicirhabdus sediminis]MBK1790490.1 ABC transporter ATP-binding protein [Persicirhabdus sediminis]